MDACSGMDSMLILPESLGAVGISDTEVGMGQSRKRDLKEKAVRIPTRKIKSMLTERMGGSTYTKLSFHKGISDRILESVRLHTGQSGSVGWLEAELERRPL